MGASDYWLKFLGTAGARVVVAKQVRASGGIWAHFGRFDAIIDPGPGTLVRALAGRPKLDPSKLHAIILTHRHLDHSADANIIADAMTNGGWDKRGWLFAPCDALDSEPVVYSYLRDAMQVQVLREGNSYRVDDVPFSTPLRMRHGVETYGLRFELPVGTVALIPDTEFFPEIAAALRAEVVILNLLRYEPHGDTAIQHLCVADVERLLDEMRPRLAVITHFGMTMLKAKPWEVAEGLTAHTGVKVVAARDGMTLDLAEAPAL